MGYVRAVRKRWAIVLATLLVALGAATALTALTPKTFQSTVSFFVSTSDTSDSNQLAQGGTFTQQRVKSYTQLVNTPKVLGPVADALGMKDGASTLAPLVTAKAMTDTVIIDVSVTSTSPTETARIARAIGTSFPDAVADLERVSDTRPSPVKVSLVRAPAAEGSLVGPNWTTNLAMAAFLGLLAGFCLALMRERTDTRIYNRRDLERAGAGTSLLASIPFDSDAATHPLILDSSAHSPRAEAFRSLRTNLRFVQAAGEHPRVIVVTSALAGEGKSSTTANLALALATSGSSVCLVEGDLRRPRLLRYLGLEGAVGLTDVLIGEAELRDVAQQFGDLPLMVVGAGATPPNPSEILGSARMTSALNELQSRFEYVIIDAPPLLPVTDAAVLASIADGAVVVTGAGIAHRAQTSKAIADLRQANAQVLGLILNRAPQEGRSSYYDYSTDTPVDAKRTWWGRRRK